MRALRFSRVSYHCVTVLTRKTILEEWKALAWKLPELSRNSDREFTVLRLIRLLVTGKGSYVEKRKLLIRLRAIHTCAAKNVTIFNIHNNLFSQKFDNKLLAIFNKVFRMENRSSSCTFRCNVDEYDAR